MTTPKLTVSLDFMQWCVRHKLFDSDELKPITGGTNERPPTDWEKMVFRKLDDLVRAKRITTATIDLIDVYKVGGVQIEKEKAEYLLALWRKNYNKEGDYEIIILP